MDKPKLIICTADINTIHGTLGMKELLSHLVNSNLFDVSYHDEIIKAGKGERATVLYYQGKKIYLDFWEYSLPCYSMEAYNANFDLIIKLQHESVTDEKFEASCLHKAVLPTLTPQQRKDYHDRIIPWTFFCSKMMNQFIGKEDTLPKLPDERIAFFCGKEWKCRHGILKKIQEWGIEYVRSDKYHGREIPLTDEEYIHKMRTSKYGLALHGRRSWFTEAKNRREIDYMILKKPLLLNYRPLYYDPMIEGKHYIYIDENTNLKDIENQYNIEEIAQNGYEWYKRNASPQGIVSSFLQIMKEKLHC